NLVIGDINGKITSFSATNATYGAGNYLFRLDVGDSSASVSPTTGIASHCASGTTTCPTGTLHVTNSGAPLDGGSFALNSAGFAEDQSIPPGNYSISAQYPGDSSYGSSSATTSFTIAKGPTATSAASTDLQVQYGRFTQLAAGLSTTSDGIAPTGVFT